MFGFTELLFVALGTPFSLSFNMTTTIFSTAAPKFGILLQLVITVVCFVKQLHAFSILCDRQGSLVHSRNLRCKVRMFSQEQTEKKVLTPFSDNSIQTVESVQRRLLFEKSLVAPASCLSLSSLVGMYTTAAFATETSKSFETYQVISDSSSSLDPTLVSIEVSIIFF